MSSEVPGAPPRAASWLFLGLSGPVGRAVQAARSPDDPDWLAISRRPPATSDGAVHWLRGQLPEAMPDMAAWTAITAIASLGPLDAFAHWFAASDLHPQRVVALGSTSIDSKRDSPEPGERALAERLAQAEATLADACRKRGIALLLLRPTLIYGMGGDRSLSPLMALARRLPCLPISRRATGLRMPVHAADLADLVLGSLRAEQPRAGCYATPGGETLTFRAMLERSLVVAAPQRRMLALPHPLFLAGCRLAQALGLIAGTSAGMLSRLDQDLLADALPARRDLNYRPRPFTPEPDMFRGHARADRED